MPDLNTLIIFFGTSVILALVPGPDNLFVMAQSVQRGYRTGWLITAGLCTGLVVHTAMAALGVSALIKASPIAFTLLRFLGALYLLYLAWLSFAALEFTANAATNAPTLAIPPKKLYLRGIVMNLSNPKVLVFFLAFLPQFIDSRRTDITLQFALLGLTFIIAAVLVFGLISVLASSAQRTMQGSLLMRNTLNAVAGVIFLGLAGNMLLIDLPS